MSPHRLRRGASHLPAWRSRQNAAFIYYQALAFVKSEQSVAASKSVMPPFGSVDVDVLVDGFFTKCLARISHKVS